ncbi:MAG: YbhB/YbcL family Raf kinase inhibitor-like protein [Candidatus Nomurabacteria bacterium]|jgi:Raf kinase inhibitor-like YbhB/YbcL family protein|nr:YbhB/YbcL family Raf kinase inhibitor-like protein [Candidatus Nomurabacteria bacterium]
MKISVQLDKNGYLPDKYAKYAPKELQNPSGNAICSFPSEISDVPSGAKTLALTFIDYDAIQVSRFAWVHWIACNIAADTKLIPENAALSGEISVVQGANSYGSFFVGETDPNFIFRYGGPKPPDADHDYTLVIYALDTELDFRDGYFLNDFYKAIRGHVVDQAELMIKARV